ncbi:MAG: hypothetical protein AAB475_00860 [Patescibacteria group bacterium]
MSKNIFKKILPSIIIAVVTSIIFSPLSINHAIAQTSGINPSLINPLLSNNTTQINQIKAKTAGILNIGSLGNNMVPTDDRKSNQKERTLDSIWMLMAKTTIRGITASMVNWINSGFQGGPAYVTDINGLLLDIADATTANFIEGTALEALCSPWKMNIKIALSLPSNRFEEDVRCTLSDIVANMDDFINGDFSQGGWAGWFELTTRNNPYNNYLASASELEARIDNAQGEEMKLLDWGNGFLSYKECEELPDGSTGRPRCKIVTPGSVIEGQLVNILGDGVRQLELADEFNEVVNALTSQLIVTVFSSVNGGLRGLSNASRGKSSYTSRLLTTEDSSAIQNVIASSEIEFGRVLNEELIYLTSKQGSLESVKETETQLLGLIQCYEGKIADKNLELTNDEKATASQRINNASSTIDAFITPRKNILISEINTQSANIIKLDSLLTDIQKAVNPYQLQVPTNELENMRRQNILRGDDTFFAEQERMAIAEEMNSLNPAINGQIKECQEFPPPSQQQNS